MQVSPARIAQGILSRDKRFLSRAITLTESSLPSHTITIGEILRTVRNEMEHQHNDTNIKNQQEQQRHKNLIRPKVAITGNPGAGKSCAVEALGMHLVENRNMSVGVLAVDPSDSQGRGGSVLGDKTRMERLSMHANAFVRPSPSRGALGGVTARAWEALEVFDGAGFDCTMVETVGVGQSEVEARHLTDVFVLLVPPLGGDDLQGVKRGIMQAADLIVVTKADENTPQQALAEQAMNFYRRSSQLTRATSASLRSQDCHSSSTEVMCISSKTGFGIPELADKIFEIVKKRQESGELQATRQRQRLHHFKSYFEQTVIARASAQLQSKGMFETFENAVVTHRRTPREAGDEALKALGLF